MFLIQLQQIGIIHSQFKEKSSAPRQGNMKAELSEIEVFPEFEPGLKDIETATHLIILYWFHMGEREVLEVDTPWDDKPHGVFATRSPNRPNLLGFCAVELLERKDNVLVVRGLDALDGTPLIDIKPYNSRSDSIPDANLGWLENAAYRNGENEKKA